MARLNVNLPLPSWRIRTFHSCPCQQTHELNARGCNDRTLNGTTITRLSVQMGSRNIDITRYTHSVMWCTVHTRWAWSTLMCRATYCTTCHTIHTILKVHIICTVNTYYTYIYTRIYVAVLYIIRLKADYAQVTLNCMIQYTSWWLQVKLHMILYVCINVLYSTYVRTPTGRLPTLTLLTEHRSTNCFDLCSMNLSWSSNTYNL